MLRFQKCYSERFYLLDALASKLNMGLINKGWYGMFFACEV